MQLSFVPAILFNEVDRQEYMWSAEDNTPDSFL